MGSEIYLSPACHYNSCVNYVLTCVTARVDSAKSVCVLWWDRSYTTSKDIINPQRPLVTTHDTISSAGPGSLLKTIPAVVWLLWSLKVTPLRPVSLFPSVFYHIQIGTVWSPAFKPCRCNWQATMGICLMKPLDVTRKNVAIYEYYQEEQCSLLTTKPSMWRRRKKNWSVQNIAPWKRNGTAMQFQINNPYI